MMSIFPRAFYLWTMHAPHVHARARARGIRKETTGKNIVRSKNNSYF